MNDDVQFMRQALALAARGVGQVAPNPMVGAVVVKNGVLVGEGWHARYGGDHAEVMALRDAGSLAIGATLYVTLEPCHHQGKTPPCTKAISEAGVNRVVYAVADPNPKAQGGEAFLTALGIEMVRGVCERDAADLNAAFMFAMRNTSRPFVSLKLAMSIDGAIVDKTRTKAWLTGSEARQAVHTLRSQVDAIAVGIGTVLADDPLLTVRDVTLPRTAPRRVVFDRHARTPIASELARSARDVPTTVFSAGINHDAENALRDLGVDVSVVGSLGEALTVLRQHGVMHLLLEGGSTLASAFLDAGFVDRLITFQAPVILGEGALPAFAALPARAVETAPRWRVVERREFGSDLMTIYAVSGD